MNSFQLGFSVLLLNFLLLTQKHQQEEEGGGGIYMFLFFNASYIEVVSGVEVVLEDTKVHHWQKCHSSSGILYIY